MSKSLPAVAVPMATLENMFEEMVQKREIAISFIKHFASEVEVGDWDSSQMPDLIMAYSSYEQIGEYLDKKFSDLTHHSDNGILFVEQELKLLSQVIKLSEECTKRLSMCYNISLEVH